MNLILVLIIIFFNNQSKWVDLSSEDISENWHTYLSNSVEGWESKDKVYVLDPSDKKNNGLVSNKHYHSFILSLEWKVDKGGNSGIFWALNENPKYSVPYLTAPEVQVIDDEYYYFRYLIEDTLSFNAIPDNYPFDKQLIFKSIKKYSENFENNRIFRKRLKFFFRI